MTSITHEISAPSRSKLTFKLLISSEVAGWLMRQMFNQFCVHHFCLTRLPWPRVYSMTAHGIFFRLHFVIHDSEICPHTCIYLKGLYYLHIFLHDCISTNSSVNSCSFDWLLVYLFNMLSLYVSKYQFILTTGKHVAILRGRVEL